MHELGLEIALDFALQCSPITRGSRPTRTGSATSRTVSIAFAENPPKKYQDIYPIDFNADMPGIEKEVETHHESVDRGGRHHLPHR